MTQSRITPQTQKPAMFHLYPHIDYREMLADPVRTETNATERGVHIDMPSISRLHQQKQDLTRQLHALNAARKRNLAPDSDASMDLTGRRLRDETRTVERDLAAVEEKLIVEAMAVPNWSFDGAGQDNAVLQVYNDQLIASAGGEELHTDHVNTCHRFDLVDFEGAARSTGAHFFALKHAAALLELALVNWTVNRTVARGFVPVAAPDAIREQFVVGSGFQPRGRDYASRSLPIYTISTPAETGSLALAGTSEIFLVAQHAGQMLDVATLPLKYVAWSHCFRSEVGHHTAASRGLYRVHQFTKVELVQVTRPEDSASAFRELTDLQRTLLCELDLPFRQLEMGRRELGAAAHRKWDHEVWMPGRRLWGEVMSASNCTDYQSRRLAIRAKDMRTGERLFPHTLNATACAVPRTVMALLEHGWRSVRPDELRLPAALKPFFPTAVECGPTNGLHVVFR